VAKNDRTVQPELQRFVAKRMGAAIYEINSSHVPMLSNPGLVIDVIRTARERGSAIRDRSVSEGFVAKGFDEHKSGAEQTTRLGGVRHAVQQA